MGTWLDTVPILVFFLTKKGKALSFRIVGLVFSVKKAKQFLVPVNALHEEVVTKLFEADVFLGPSSVVLSLVQLLNVNTITSGLSAELM